MDEKNTPEVGDHVPRVHTPLDDSPEAIAAARVQDLAVWEMTHNVVIDNTAHGTFHQADVGRPGTYGNTYAKTNGVTTSPKIPYHDNIWSALKSKHAGIDSSGITEMMAYIYGGLSPEQASVNNYESYSRTRFEEMMAMDEVEAMKFTGEWLFGDDEDEEEEGE